MKKIVIVLIFLWSLSSFSQVEDAWYFIRDKPNATTFLANPLTMLSQQALDRRNKQYIALDIKDVPIDAGYLADIKSVDGLTILGKSKWLNAVHVQGLKNKIVGAFSNLPFIEKIEFADKTLTNLTQKSINKITPNHLHKLKVTLTDFNYGQASNQIKMLNGDFLHKEGLTGEGQIIAIMDGGFPNVNTLTPFERLRTNNQILGGYNFADRNTNIYTRNSHGTLVLSTIGGYIENEFVGTAPDAKFYLFITEITETETVLEETLWVEAAERADSLGVNVINTSLGYTTFDNPKHNYSYADMDGKTTFITRGAEIASSRGILVVNSAGNEGNVSWKYISAPADAPSVITVGAVDKDGNIAGFSSYGPTADNRIKPEIVAQGVKSALINHTTGAIGFANGTSFSSPIMAGLIACLNQNESFLLKGVKINKGNSKSNNDYLKEAVYQSASKFGNPTDQFGYGIPNFENAYYYYRATGSVEETELNTIKIAPNPISTSFKIDNITGEIEDYAVYIFDVLGKEIYKSKLTSTIIDISFVKSGIYFLKISKGIHHKTVKIIKK